MNVLGIIAEYNPFHNGHRHHLRQSFAKTGADAAICAMSGSFTQRGDAALCDKWTRAAMAAASGVDLVLELPTAFAVRSAQNFAAGGVALLSALNVVDTLCFGAEENNLPRLQAIARRCDAPETALRLRSELDAGKSYAAALSCAVGAADDAADASLLKRPNNILAVEYLRAIARLHSDLQPVLIERRGAQYHDAALRSSLASATAIRRALREKNAAIASLAPFLPPPSLRLLEGAAAAFPDLSRLEGALLAKLRLMRPAALAEIAGVSEGLENKISAAALRCASLDALLDAVKSKRYPRSRLQRLLLCCLLDLRQADLREYDKSGPLYARVLAFTDRGRALLKTLKRRSAIPIVAKTAKLLTTNTRGRATLSAAQQMLALDTYATDLYQLCFSPGRAGAQDFTRSPVYVKAPP